MCIRDRYNSLSTPIDFGFDFHLAMGPNQINLSDQNMKAPASFVGKLSTDYVQLLPKFAIQYEWKNQNNVYATVTRGYRSGAVSYTHLDVYKRQSINSVN